MRIDEITPTIQTLFCRCLIANELGGRLSLAYVFSDAKKGKSGRSFGVSQLDINNNPYAVLCLREAGFTTDDIEAVKGPLAAAELAVFNSRLFNAKPVVDKWDARQVKECLSVPLALCNEVKVEFSRLETFLHIADYHNQFYMSRGGKLYTWLKMQAVPVSPEMIKDFKLKQTKWGQDGNMADIESRYDNIKRIVLLQDETKTGGNVQ